MSTIPSATAKNTPHDRAVVDAIDLLSRVVGLNDLIYLAGSVLYQDDTNRTEAGAIQMGSHILGEVLTDIQNMLEKYLEARYPAPAAPATSSPRCGMRSDSLPSNQFQ